MDTNNIEHRLLELETKLAFQEATLDDLNKVIIEQQQLIYKLEKHQQLLVKKLSNIQLSNLAPFNEEEPPPHY